MKKPKRIYAIEENNTFDIDCLSEYFYMKRIDVSSNRKLYVNSNTRIICYIHRHTKRVKIDDKIQNELILTYNYSLQKFSSTDDMYFEVYSTDNLDKLTTYIYNMIQYSDTDMFSEYEQHLNCFEFIL